jgi:hypothetical protein
VKITYFDPELATLVDSIMNLHKEETTRFRIVKLNEVSSVSQLKFKCTGSSRCETQWEIEEKN